VSTRRADEIRNAEVANSEYSCSFAKISSEGKRLPSSMSERKGEEMPILIANPRKDKSALSRNSRIRWPKEISIIVADQY
jgi:hypothetical protein